MLGRRFDLATAARLLDRRVGTLLPAVSAELLAEDGDRLAFRCRDDHDRCGGGIQPPKEAGP
ncbi:hypothetical protein [Streptomyces sp. NRRL S-813]|uniref:hypothetical protein n=1 Tax=Streptomyces sp. NRRL S-813 TaxID=1463919 RepID=UPI000A7C6A77|nr:hypothetical protein [Streptomyces sp. NRRL S-813]